MLVVLLLITGRHLCRRLWRELNGENAWMSKAVADIGIFGGSGFYKLLEDAEQRVVETPYGAPSDKIMLGRLAGKRVAFLPRHGAHHQLPPHMINFRANIWAMKFLGVHSIIGPCAAGSLQPHVKPGDFVVCDQYVDRTSGRKDTFYDGPVATHVSDAEPYCKELRELAVKAASDSGITVHDKGTVVVIQGPRFSTKSESRWFTAMGWEVINMTQYPEVHLAREQEIAYVNISLITDYDSGLVGDVEPVSHAEVVKVFGENIAKLQNMLLKLLREIPENPSNWVSHKTLEGARFC
jgi:5'-methylthioadenosine phosphorylase